MSNFGQGGVLRSKPVFTVNCEKVGKGAWYKVMYPPNNQLNDRIKLTAKHHHKWSLEDHCWHVHIKALYEIIKLYRKSDKIKFEFGAEGKADFIEQIKKIDQIIEEKADKIERLKKKNEEAIKWKQELEENYLQYEPEVLKYLKPGVKLYPHQVVAMMFLKKVINGLLSLEMGLGKCQRLDSQLLSPNGWVKMGEVKVGDKVIGSDGKAHKIIGVFPQGIKDIYRVTFNDNTFTECCDEHLWAVNTPTRLWRTKNGSNKYPNRVLTLRQIMDEGLTFNNGNRRHYIPIVEPIQFDTKKLLINPYLLGCLLGDGGLTEKTPTFSSLDEEILIKVEDALPENCRMIGEYKDYDIVRSNHEIRYNPLNKLLESYGLSGRNSHTKFIPDDYKFGSIEQRLQLLQGLLDTDGHIYKDGSHIEITLASKQLIDDLQFIVQSLGGIGRIKNKWITYKGEKRKYYRMGIKLPPQYIPFKLNRKIERYKPVSKYLPARAISKIEYIGEHEAQCISVDAKDNLYVTDYCILTHNTLCSIGYAEMMGFKKILVITPNSLKYNYRDEVDKFTLGKKAHILSGKPIAKKNLRKIQQDRDDSNYLIVNYDYFNPKDFKKVQSKFNALNLGFIECVVMDESHMIKNTSSNTYKNIKKLIKEIPSKVFLSGTPAPNRVKELYTVLNIISPLDFATKTEFYEHYCGLTYIPRPKKKEGEDFDADDDIHYQGGWQQSEGGMRLEELYHKIAPYTFRKRKFEVLKDLPDKIYQKILIEMTDEQQEQYEKIEEGVANEIFSDEQMSSVNMLTIMLRLRQYTSMIKGAPTVDLVKRLLEEGEKSVVVDQFKEPILEMKKLLGDVAGLHTGDENADERNVVKTDFQDPNGKIMVFLASIATTKYGLTLTAASKLFMTTLPWSPGEYDQVADRCILKGQLVVTKNGYKPIENVKIGDLVYTHKGNWKRVIDLWSRIERKKLHYKITYKGFYAPLECTNDHKIFVFDINDELYKWIRADQLNIMNHYMVLPKLNISTESSTEIQLIYNKSLKHNSKHIKEKITLNESLLYAMGRFIGDGWTNENDVCICGHINEENEVLECINAINEGFGLPNTYNKRIVSNENRVDFSIFCRELRDVFFDFFGKDSYSKQIPEFVFGLANNLKKSLLKGIYDSDGYRRNNTQQLSTTSNYLPIQISLLEGLLGNTPTLRYNESKKDQPFWSFEYSLDDKIKRNKLIKNRNGVVLYPIEMIEVSRFKRNNERVYDLTVEDDNSFIVGLSTVHNCHRIGQKDTVFIYPMVVKGTIDEYVFNMIEKKRIEITKALDNEDYHSNVEESILAELLAMLKEKYGKKKEDSEKNDDAESIK